MIQNKVPPLVSSVFYAPALVPSGLFWGSGHHTASIPGKTLSSFLSGKTGNAALPGNSGYYQWSYGSEKRACLTVLYAQIAYDTIPRQDLWSHFCRIRMPATLLSALQSLFAGDQYLLQDGHTAARVKPTVGVKQGCPLSPLLFLLYINGIVTIAEGVQGAVSGSEDVQVTCCLLMT